ncbi:MAG: ABC transporter permease subunit [Planctomycetales bacterium]|nr:ABC transporter permease subunit [Planctomycetales bacterium]
MMLPKIFISDWLNSFLTPLFLLGLGSLAALVVLAVIWGLIAAVSRPRAAAAWNAVYEGPLQWLVWLAVTYSVIGVVGLFAVRDRDAILGSIPRLSQTGMRTVTRTIPPPSGNEELHSVDLALPFQGDEFRSLTITSTGLLAVSIPTDGSIEGPLAEWTVDAGEEVKELITPARPNPVADKQIEKFIATNAGSRPVDITLVLETEPIHPEVRAIFYTMGGVLVVFAVYLIVNWLMPKTSAVALAAAKSEMSQPLYWLLLLVSAFLLLVFIFVPYFTFGDDIKVLKDTGLVLILTVCVFHTILAANNQISDEIESRTALTLLSKPIGRPQFVWGKFLGIAWTELAMTAVLGGVFLAIVCYKVIYDSRESAEQIPTWQVCYQQLALTAPGLWLIFLECLVFIGISLAISTRLPLMANFVVSFAIFALGHLTPQLVHSNAFEPVVFIGTLIATILPVLDYFNVYAGIAGGKQITPEYLGVATLYCALYCSIMMLLALALFEDRDLA